MDFCSSSVNLNCSGSTILLCTRNVWEFLQNSPLDLKRILMATLLLVVTENIRLGESSYAAYTEKSQVRIYFNDTDY